MSYNSVQMLCFNVSVLTQESSSLQYAATPRSCVANGPLPVSSLCHLTFTSTDSGQMFWSSVSVPSINLIFRHSYLKSSQFTCSMAWMVSSVTSIEHHQQQHQHHHHNSVAMISATATAICFPFVFLPSFLPSSQYSQSSIQVS